MLAFHASLRNAENCVPLLRGGGEEEPFFTQSNQIWPPSSSRKRTAIASSTALSTAAQRNSFIHSSNFGLHSSNFGLLDPTSRRRRSRSSKKLRCSAAMDFQGLWHGVLDLLQQDPPSWTSAVAANAFFLVAGFPALRAGLTFPAMASAFGLGTLSWKAFGAPGFLLLVFYFVVGTGVTKVELKQKEKEGIAEKRSGKRGSSSVWGSGAAGMVCAIAAIADLGGSDLSYLWQLGFVASFATKLSDTVSSEIGKAYGKTTYLVTTLKKVPRGTEGAVSLEGTLAGLSASLLFCAFAYNLNQVTARDALISLLASQVANLLESYAGATLQGKKGFEWVSNDVVNVLNISFGASAAIAASFACDKL